MSKALELAKFGRETPPTGVVVGDSDAQTLSSKTFSDGPVFSSGTANGIPYLNGSKVFTTGSALVFDGTNFGVGIASPAAKLHVNVAGDNETTIARFGVTSAGSVVSQFKVLADPTGSLVKFDATGSVSNGYQFLTGGGFRAQLNSFGYFSLGTVNATEVLTVSNTNYEALGLYRNLDYNSVGANGVRMYFGGFVGSTATRTAFLDATMMTATTGRLALGVLIGGTLTEALRIETNGSVRIGGTFAAQSASAEKLTVDGVSSQAATLSNSSDSYGTVYLKNRSTTAATIQPYLYFNDGSGANRGGFGVKYTDASVHQFAQGGINWYVGSAGFSGLAATLTSTGLGIGTALPGANLEIAAGGPQLILNANTQGTNVKKVRLGASNNVAGDFVISAINDDNSFKNYMLHITNSGNVGIGTTNAASKLEVVTSTAGAHNLRIYNSSNDASSYSQLQMESSAGNFYMFKQSATSTGYGGAGSINLYSAGAYPMNFWTNSTEAMRITSDRNIAIGTTANTAQKLNVNGAIWLLGNDDANYSTVISARYDSSNSFTMQTRLNSGTMSEFLALYSQGGGSAPRLSLTPNGWPVVIGSTTSARASSKLDIRGDIMTLGSNGSYYATIDYNAGLGLLSLAAESGGAIRFLSGTAERLRIAANGTLISAQHQIRSYVNSGTLHEFTIESSSQTNGGYLKILNDGAVGGVRGIRLGVHGNGSTPDSGNTDVLVVTDSARVGIGTTSPDAKLTVANNGQSIGTQQTGNGADQGTAQFLRVVKLCPSVSSNNKLIIPFVSQGSLNSNTVCRVMGHNAAYNTSAPQGFEITFAVGHLNAMYSFSYWGAGGNAVSAAVVGQTVEITFSSSYNIAYATSGGVFITLEYMTNFQNFSIDVPNVRLN